jgi:adenylate kinase family enzyme
MIRQIARTAGIERIAIVGISGTGKSAIGVRLAEKTGLKLHHMDAIIWSPGWVETPEESIRVTLAGIAASDHWIVEGWVDSYSKDILHRSGIVLYLDYPGWLAALGGVQRWWKQKGKKRPELPEGCIDGFDPDYLRTMLGRRERPHIEAILAEVPDLKIVRVRSRREAERVLDWLVAETA